MSPGAAAGEHDGMHLLHEVAGGQQIGLARAGRGAAHIDTGHGARARDDHGAARGATTVAVVAYLDAGHVGDGAGGGCVMHGAPR